jgi:hypothetical protein
LSTHIDTKDILLQISQCFEDVKADQQTMIATQQDIRRTARISEEHGGFHTAFPYFCFWFPLTDTIIKALLEKLRPVYRARHDAQNAPPGCLENTRVEVLDQLEDWAANPSDQPILWLTGFAGTGKTAIIRTICERLSARDLLGASFFISRSSVEQKTPQNIIRSIIHQLSYTRPSLRPFICDALRANPILVEQSMDYQVEHLISRPLRATEENQSSPVILVIDGLDECDKDMSDTEGDQLLCLLLRVLRDCPHSLKLLVSSRREHNVHLELSNFKPIALRLHEVERSVVYCDIQRYFEHSLQKIATQSRDPAMADWPLKQVAIDLTNRADGVFIFATTVIKYINHKRYLPSIRLKEVVSSPVFEPSSTIFHDLDSLYLQVLNSTSGDDNNQGSLSQRVRRLLGIIIALQEPLSVSSLACLLNEDERILRLDLEALSAVLVVPESSSGTIRVFHQSFVDFLLDSTRCKDSRFLIKAVGEEFHGALVARCFELMRDEIRPKKQHLHHSGSKNEAISNTLPYARQYCLIHADWSPHKAREIADLCRELVQCHDPDHPNRHIYVHRLSRVLYIRFLREGGDKLLSEIIGLRRELLRLCPSGHSDRHYYLHVLGNALVTQYQQTGDADSLAEAIHLNREALAIRTPGHPSRDFSLVNLATALEKEFKRTAKADYLAEAICLHREALELRGKGHPYYDYSLAGYAVVLEAEFKRTGDATLLVEAIRHLREALYLRRLNDHPARDSALHDLATALLTQFSEEGDIAVLNESISLLREALTLRTSSNPRRRGTLERLVEALELHSRMTGNLDTLKESRTLRQEDSLVN